MRCIYTYSKTQTECSEKTILKMSVITPRCKAMNTHNRTIASLRDTERPLRLANK